MNKLERVVKEKNASNASEGTSGGTSADGPNEDTPYLFVFGTLMRKHDHPAGLQLNEEATYVGEATIQAAQFSWPRRPQGYPTLSGAGEPGQEVHGEVYQVTNPTTWVWMDRYEGRPHLFDRKVMPIKVGDVWLNCWVYEYQER